MAQTRFILSSLGVAVGLFFAIVLFIELGRQLKQRRVKHGDANVPSNVGVVDSSVYGLLALLIGFTFSGAASRFDHRRELVFQESNAATTAWHRIDLLPAAQQPAVRDGMRRYLDSVIAWYAGPATMEAMLIQPASVTRAEDELWKRSVDACLSPGGDVARMLLLPTLNELFDTVDAERMARRLHPPTIVWAMLGIAAIAAALFAGYGFAGSPRNWLYITGLAASISVSTYVIIELEFPRLGLTRVSGIDDILVEARASLE